MLRLCPCLGRRVEDVRVLDYHHASLTAVPDHVFACERTLEELHLDSNQIRDLPPQLFLCHGLRHLSLCDNEIQTLPAALASLTQLQHLDFSKNGVTEVSDGIKGCKRLDSLQASVNPLGKIPEGLTHLLNLTQLYLNDTFLDYLPGNFGRLSGLKILELRANHLKTLPRSIGRMKNLEKIDIGQNDMVEFPDILGSCSALLEIWCDNSQITSIPPSFGNLTQLIYFDASRNRIESLPDEIEGCISLADLHLSYNSLTFLPETLGQLSNLTTLKLDNNELRYLPFSLGGLHALSELNISLNQIEELPTSFGLLRNLRTLYADQNQLREVPSELGSCSGITVMSLSCNQLRFLPDEVGRISRLRVLNLSDNRLECLPHTFLRLKHLQALWLADNQAQPLVPLQTDVDRLTGARSLTCYLLPQQPWTTHEDENTSSPNSQDNSDFTPEIWNQDRQQRIHFDNVRNYSPSRSYPKEMKDLKRHTLNEAILAARITPGTPSLNQSGIHQSVSSRQNELNEQNHIGQTGYNISMENVRSPVLRSAQFEPAKTSTPVTGCVQEEVHAAREAHVRGQDLLMERQAVLAGRRGSGPQTGVSPGTASRHERRSGYESESAVQYPRRRVSGYDSESGVQYPRRKVSGYESETAVSYPRFTTRKTNKSGYDSEGGYKSDSEGYRRRYEMARDGDVKRSQSSQKFHGSSVDYVGNGAYNDRIWNYREMNSDPRTFNNKKRFSREPTVAETSPAMMKNDAVLPMYQSPNPNRFQGRAMSSPQSPSGNGAHDHECVDRSAYSPTSTGISNHPAWISGRQQSDSQYRTPVTSSQISSSTDSGYAHDKPPSSRCPGPFENPRDLAGPRTPAHAGVRMAVTINKNPGLGFSIAGGVGSPGNPYKPNDMGIFVTKVHEGGSAEGLLCPGDKLLEVNGQPFLSVDHKQAVSALKFSPCRVNLVIERDSIV